MQYLGTSFSIVLGAWRLRLQVALEDAIDDRPSAPSSPQTHLTHHLVAVGGRRG